ncbi:hypothetical protein MJO52_03090 [Microbulbifer variabilis]|uniref:Uncharacterized protein n=1 Tax=Microbulbifer variabilis TaxID=266805 RepID=A0ABY4VCV3_9GAMM|nr:hypothetical protein [Microbulbifer variabilis]USD22135.1 hypothetical protein MJO52_03090 [Microbulbifer variabilis]
MTVVTLTEAQERIMTTVASRPLAVFRTDNPRQVDLVFAHTVVTQNKIREVHEDYLGTFHRDNLHVARKVFRENAESLRAAA